MIILRSFIVSDSGLGEGRETAEGYSHFSEDDSPILGEGAREVVGDVISGPESGVRRGDVSGAGCVEVSGAGCVGVSGTGLWNSRLVSGKGWAGWKGGLKSGKRASGVAMSRGLAS